tara:strand:+ start:3638 stop:4849 length:1212 start_codon:yes stop_codon:yes gene_type:complete
LRILFFTQYFWPENFRINELATFLSTDKKKQYVLTGNPSYPNKKLFKNSIKENEKYQYQNLNIMRVPVILRNNSNLSIILNYVSFFLSTLFLGGPKILKNKIDLIFIFCPSPILSAIPGILFKIAFKKKSVLWVLDLWPDTLVDLNIVRNKLVIRILKRLIKFVYDNNDLILAQSIPMRDQIKKLTKTKCIYFPSWPEQNVFDNQKVIKNLINECKTDQIKILFAGNVGQAQSFETLIECAKLLKEKKLVKWIILGDGRWKNELKKLIKNAGLTDDFQLLNRVPIENIGSYFKEVDALYLSLKKNETFNKTIPGKLQTYMNSSKPIIASISGETNRIINESKCGFVSEAEDYLTLRDNILKFYNLNTHEKKKLGYNGKNYSDINFNKMNILSNLEQEIESILK